MKKHGFLLLLGSLVFASCGKDKAAGVPGGGNGDMGDSINAQFIDAPVKGLRFLNESGTSSVTGNEGKFTCKRGELITFEIGTTNKTVLGNAACGERIFVQDLSEGISGDGDWLKAAMLIQSFAIPQNDGKLLDLSLIDQAQIPTVAAGSDLSSFTTNLEAAFVAAKTNDVFKEVQNDKIPADFKSASSAGAEAAAGLNDFNSLELSDYEMLTKLAGKPVVLNAKLTSGTILDGKDGEECWENFNIKAQIDAPPAGLALETQSTKPIYKFRIEKVAGFTDATSVAESGVDCINLENDTCEEYTGTNLPSPKILTSNKIDLAVNRDLSDRKLKLGFSLNSEIEGNQLLLKGNFQSSETLTIAGETEDGKVFPIGTKISCKYSVSGVLAVAMPGPPKNEEDEGVL